MTTRLREAASHAPTHPALRWTPQWRPDVRAQHRRTSATATACGITDVTLVLADDADPYCRACFPGAPA